ncbi:hypothetical protein CfE428DRAFT_4468 [Chthoniobacter flavus Ellin428]|uniref:PEP-CTERM protein-sorting domain-containing protein n=1 Tax=Chthoniobacter flavus Ellin428 TaxID=497964 RepID=B4D6C8_9BACT|nr:NF038129 family PEP-CTERM protein [Chthoniobacter flavus]EDY18037.1 hypothetical protein CfE428DRAFT_4468 [Chthoniobacter flavus Ellin428]TCO88280.1 putative secreted protein with PEP-CTERM sorting signal [Chthoniobacter flavus]
MNAYFSRNLTKLALAVAAVLTPAVTHANNFNFHVDLNVASLVGAPNSPFFVDFQLNEGSGTLPNSVSLSNFVFTGGSASGSATAFGLATGDMGSTITLNDNSSNQFNEIFQGFTAGTTDIQFDVSVSQNAPGVTPDGFLVSILNSDTNNPAIGTTDTTNSTMLTLPISAANALGDIQTFTSTSPSGATANVTSPVPEPTTVAAMIGGLGCLIGLRRRGVQASA